ncbi:MAG: hypothetical protein QE277_03205 [Flectobacillus sp.]|nr:hypothetical protein [Flectobacillus sp.]
MTNILTISTLYNKGGAAYIARQLHEGFKERGFSSHYLYGYDKKGLPSKHHQLDVESLNSSFTFIPHLNYISHKLLGKDYFSPNTSILEDRLVWADVVICHTLHSHLINFQLFFTLLTKYAPTKKIIFVAHDSWFYTGRCAFKFSCEDWLSGCLECSYKKYYPSTLLSNSKLEFERKKSAIAKIPNLFFVTPAKWIQADLEKVFSNKVFLVRNGIDTSYYENILRKNEKKIGSKPVFCVSCVDLLQEGKVDLVLVEELLKLGFTVNLIGKNNPFKNYPNAISHGYISEKNKYLKVLSDSDCYLFSSTIDIYPTVLIDAICSGCFIFYTDSQGAIEIMESGNSWLGIQISNATDIINYTRSTEFASFCDDLALRTDIVQKARTFFSRDRMIQEYINIL